MLSDKIRDLADELEELEDDKAYFEEQVKSNDSWLKVEPVSSDISLGDMLEINNMLKETFKRLGIRYEDHT